MPTSSLVGIAGKDAKFGLKEMSQFTDFHQFSNHLVESQLKTCYVKDLLHTLNSIDVPLFDATAAGGFAGLIELVLRRNVHIHNRGRVDERYSSETTGGLRDGTCTI